MKHTRISFSVSGQTLAEVYEKADQEFRKFTGLAPEDKITDLVSEIDYDIDCERLQYTNGESAILYWIASVTAKIQTRE